MLSNNKMLLFLRLVLKKILRLAMNLELLIQQLASNSKPTAKQFLDGELMVKQLAVLKMQPVVPLGS